MKRAAGRQLFFVEFWPLTGGPWGGQKLFYKFHAGLDGFLIEGQVLPVTL